jgi:peptidyl-dipeptidase Dcp
MRTGKLGMIILATSIIVSPAFNLNPMKISDNNIIEAIVTEDANPLLAPWKGPYGGVPPFDKVQVAHFKPAIQQVMEQRLAAVDKIAGNKKAADFENTIAALERTRNIMAPVMTIYNIWGSNLSTPEYQAVEMELAPQLSAIEDKIIQNEKLFKRIEAVYNAPEKKKLTAEQQRLVWLYYTNFVRAGARLDANAKKRLADINQELAKQFTKFRINVMADETNHYVVLENESDLTGLPQSLIDAASAEADSKNLKGKWVITNTRSSVDPFLQYASNRSLREKVWKMFVNRGDNGDEYDNNAIITEILKLRKERARLLGYETRAHWRLENTMAKTPAKALELLEAVWTPAIGRVKEEVADMQALANREGDNIKIEPWDYQYYMEKVRKEKFDLDQNEVKPYLQIDKLREGMFFVAGELFNFQFTPVTNVPVFHPDVKVWEVKDKTNGKHIGLFYFDPFARPGKRSGAWMNAYRTQERMDKDITTIVSNNSNYIKGKPGEPVLISWDDAETLFHEFGHALHGLSSNVTYPSLAGTAVFRDYVEFPSQLLERWLSTPEVLERFALHYQTGKPIPKELVNKIEKASTFNQGFGTTEYLASALIDMKLHMSTETEIDPDKFERETLNQLKMPRELVMRHRTPQFLHIFSGDSYSAGYYSYIWSDVLTADAYEAFLEAGGPYDKNVAERLRKYIFSPGNTIDPEAAYRSFRTREARIDALMKDRGFAEAK